MARTKKAAKKPSAVDANRRRNTKKHAQQRSVVHWYLDRTAKEIARLKEVEDADAAMAAPNPEGDNIEVQSSSDVSEEDQFAGTLRELAFPVDLWLSPAKHLEVALDLPEDSDGSAAAASSRAGAAFGALERASTRASGSGT